MNAHGIMRQPKSEANPQTIDSELCGEPQWVVHDAVVGLDDVKATLDRLVDHRTSTHNDALARDDMVARITSSVATERRDREQHAYEVRERPAHQKLLHRPLQIPTSLPA